MAPDIDFGSLILQSLFASIPTILKTTWPLLLVILAILLIKLSIALHRKYKLTKAGMTEIDAMDGKTFEDFLAELFRKLGYTVKQVGSFAGDYGADLVVAKGNIAIAVQAKRHKSVIGVDAVREVLSSIKMYNCSSGLVVTNSYFTRQAKKLAAVNHIELWDRNALADQILSSQQDTAKL